MRADPTVPATPQMTAALAETFIAALYDSEPESLRKATLESWPTDYDVMSAALLH